VTVGFHRYFTHGAFKATRGLRITLAAVGGMALQGPVVGWEGDPHSPWRRRCSVD
jgi:stearoyl-CoA desaturase (delta-9 desaturase)